MLYQQSLSFANLNFSCVRHHLTESLIKTEKTHPVCFSHRISCPVLSQILNYIAWNNNGYKISDL